MHTFFVHFLTVFLCVSLVIMIVYYNNIWPLLCVLYYWSFQGFAENYNDTFALSKDA